MIGLLRTSHAFAAATDSGMWMPNRGRTNARLNGPTHQAIAPNKYAAVAKRMSGAATEIQIASEIRKRKDDVNPA